MADFVVVALCRYTCWLSLKAACHLTDLMLVIDIIETCEYGAACLGTDQLELIGGRNDLENLLK